LPEDESGITQQDHIRSAHFDDLEDGVTVDVGAVGRLEVGDPDPTCLSPQQCVFPRDAVPVDDDIGVLGSSNQCPVVVNGHRCVVICGCEDGPGWEVSRLECCLHVGLPAPGGEHHCHRPIEPPTPEDDCRGDLFLQTTLDRALLGGFGHRTGGDNEDVGDSRASRSLN